MTGVESGPDSPEQRSGPKRFLRIRLRYWGIVTAAVVVVIGLLLPTLGGGWAPLLHNTCEVSGSPVASLFAWVPALLVNSPFGGEGYGNGTVPPGPLSSPGQGTVYGIGEANGAAAWAGFRAEINISTVKNQTVWGPGVSVRCDSPFSISVNYWGGAVLGGPLLGEGNRSDLNESTSLNHWTYPGDVNLTFANGFLESNSGTISTCGQSALSRGMTSPQFEVKIPVVIGGTHYLVPYTLGIQETFHYVFSSDFGTWQIDNLSAPGGPGGGWAFNFVGPCT